MINSGSGQVTIYKRDGAHVYDGDGRIAGVLPETIAPNLAIAQYRLKGSRDGHQSGGTPYRGIQQGTEEWTQMVNAHDFMFDPTEEKPETTSVKVNRNEDGTLTVDAVDGRSYRYGSDRLNLISVERTKR